MAHFLQSCFWTTPRVTPILNSPMLNSFFNPSKRLVTSSPWMKGSYLRLTKSKCLCLYQRANERNLRSKCHTVDLDGSETNSAYFNWKMFSESRFSFCQFPLKFYYRGSFQEFTVDLKIVLGDPWHRAACENCHEYLSSCIPSLTTTSIVGEKLWCACLVL